MAGKRRQATSPPLKKRKKTEAKSNTHENDAEVISNREELQKKLTQPMPNDFFDVWELCHQMCPGAPSDALLPIDLKLSGPYNILDGSVTATSSSEHLHSRHYYDPPEFTTVMQSTSSDNGFHLGYYRDSPSGMPSLVASNDTSLGYEFRIIGDNLVAALTETVRLKRKQSKADCKMLDSLGNNLTALAKRGNHSLELNSAAIKKRQKLVVTKTFHGLGLVIPLDENEVGYRPLPKSDAQLKKLLQRIVDAKTDKQRKVCFDELQEILTLVQFANDECDYGMGYELGMDLFLFGSEVLHKSARRLLTLAYDLLEREDLGTIFEEHMNNRQMPFVSCKE